MTKQTRKIKAIFMSGFHFNIEERLNEAKEFDNVKEAREFFKSKLQINKSVFVPGTGYYKLIVVSK